MCRVLSRHREQGSMVLGDRVDGVSRCVHGLPRPCVFCSRSYWAVMLFMAGMLVFLWFALGPSHPWYAVLVVMGTLTLGPVVAGPVMRRVPRHWFRVPAGERVLHRMLGVGIFRWLLACSGWERHVHKREFHATRAGLPSLGVALRSNASATEPALPSTYYWPPSHFSPGTRGAHCGSWCRAWSFTLPGAATALHHASPPASVG